MPVLVFMKEPPMTMVMSGTLASIPRKMAVKALGRFIEGKAIDDQPVWIPCDKNSNIAYLKEITDEEFKRMEEKKKDMQDRQKGGRITPAHLMTTVGRDPKRGN